MVRRQRLPPRPQLRLRVASRERDHARYPQFQIPVDLFAKTATTTAALGPLLGPFPQVREAVGGAIESMLSGASSPDEAMEIAVKEGNAAISDYNRRMGR